MEQKCKNNILGRSHQDAWLSDAALHLVLHNFTFFGRVASPSDDCCCCFAGDSIGRVSVRSKLVSSHEVGSFSDSKCVNAVTLGNAWRMSASILSNSQDNEQFLRQPSQFLTRFQFKIEQRPLSGFHPIEFIDYGFKSTLQGQTV